VVTISVNTVEGDGIGIYPYEAMSRSQASPIASSWERGFAFDAAVDLTLMLAALFAAAARASGCTAALWAACAFSRTAGMALMAMS
jgi:hypothetical protein